MRLFMRSNPKHAGSHTLLGFVAVALSALAAGCEPIFEPGTEWLVGTWRVVYAFDDSQPEPTRFLGPNATTLVLEPDGRAVVVTGGLPVSRTRFYVTRESGWNHTAVWFRDPVLTSRAHRVDRMPAESLALLPTRVSCEHCVYRYTLIRQR